MVLAGHSRKRNMCAKMVTCFAVGLVTTRLRPAGASGKSRSKDCNFPRHTDCPPASAFRRRHRCGRVPGTDCFPIPGTAIPIFGNCYRLLPACAMVKPVAWMLRSVGEAGTSAWLRYGPGSIGLNAEKGLPDREPRQSASAGGRHPPAQPKPSITWGMQGAICLRRSTARAPCVMNAV